MKVYIVNGYGVDVEKVFTNKETAEEEAKKIMYCAEMGGRWVIAKVKEVELVED